jgi:hypothetical protein
MAVYFNINSKLFMPIFTIKLTARSLPPETGIDAADKPLARLIAAANAKILPGKFRPKPARTPPPARPLTLAGFQPKTGAIHRQDRQLNAPPCHRRPAL